VGRTQETVDARANSASGRASEAAIIHCSSLSELRCSIRTGAPVSAELNAIFDWEQSGRGAELFSVGRQSGSIIINSNTLIRATDRKLQMPERASLRPLSPGAAFPQLIYRNVGLAVAGNCTQG